MSDWPDNVRCHEKAAFEPIYRRLVETAVGFLELLAKERRVLPLFSGGHIASAKNETAEEMWNQLEAALSVASSDAQPTNLERAKAFTFAVRAAYRVREGGFGTKGWAHFFITLPRVRPAPSSPAPERQPDVIADVRTSDLPPG